MSLKTNRFLSALARGSSSLRIKLRKPLNTKEEGVSPGCTRLLRKNTCKHTRTHGPQVFVLSASRVSLGEREYWVRFVFFCLWVRDPFAPFCRWTGAPSEHRRRETAWPGEVLAPLAFHCSWSQWAGRPCCHPESCTAALDGNTNRSVRCERWRDKRESVGGKVREKKNKVQTWHRSQVSPRGLPARTELSSVWVSLVELLQHLLTLSVGERVAEGEVGCGSSRLQNPVSEGEDELVFYNLNNVRETEIKTLMCFQSLFLTAWWCVCVCVFTSHVGLSRTRSHRALPGEVRTRGAMPWL